MSKYLDTSGKPSRAIAVCDRCKLKMALSDMVSDGNTPSIRGHKECVDVKDPWRLPARQTENITLRFPRPDTDIQTPAVPLPIPDGDPV